MHVSQDGQEEQEGHVWQCVYEMLKKYENGVIATLVGESGILGNLSLQQEPFSALVERAGTDRDGRVGRIVQYRMLDPLCPYQLSSIVSTDSTAAVTTSTIWAVRASSEARVKSIFA